MNRIILIGIFLALLCAGCIDSDSGESEKAAGQAGSKLIATIISPRPGEILSGDEDFKFDSDVKGGIGPYAYSWTSNINGLLSGAKSFSLKGSRLSPGEHNLVLTVTDSSGQTAQASVLIRVM